MSSYLRGPLAHSTPGPWRRPIAAALVALFAMTLPVQGAAAATGSNPPVKTAVKAAPVPAVPDQELQERIQTKFTKAKAGAGKFTVRVSGGVAYLSGRTEVPQHKGAATRMAKTAGAKGVVNNIVVTGKGREKAAGSGPAQDEAPRTASVR